MGGQDPALIGVTSTQGDRAAALGGLRRRVPQSGSRAVLLLNLGTPDDPGVPAVRRYLREFLSDPRVIDLPAVPRWLLVNGVIAPFRAPKSAAAYRKVWRPDGSPLLVHTRALADALAQRTGLPVAVGMRYGRPSVADALEAVDGADELVVVPLYPQYASATTGTALEQLYATLGRGPRVPAVRVVPPLVGDDRWLRALIDVTRPHVADAEHIVFSFHGLPESALRTTSAACRIDDTCCEAGDPRRGYCYRAQSRHTARALGGAFGRPWTLAWQSRLGRAKWLGPSTVDVVDGLARDGVRDVAVVAPSFVCDCLETLEELGVSLAEHFRAAGGTRLRVVPCLNAQPAWADALAEIVLG